jgi:hypothetical protein
MTADEARSAFEKRFGPSFQRLYAYVLKRTKNHAAAERLTRQVLVHSLPEFLDEDEAQLARVLLRNANHALGAEAEARRPLPIEKTEYALE